MEQIISTEEAIKEIYEKQEGNIKQFSNPKKVGKKINGLQIILLQFLIVLLIILAMLLIKFTAPDLFEQINEYLKIRFGAMK